MPETKQFTGLFDNLLFLKIFKTFRMAIQPSKLIIAFGAIAVLCVVGLLMDLSKTVVTAPGVTAVDIGSSPMSSRIISEFPTELHCFVAAPDKVKDFSESYDSRGSRIGVFSVLSRFCSSRFNDGIAALFSLNFTAVFIQLSMCFQAVVWAFLHHTIYSIVFFSAVAIAVAIVGGAICRMTALQLANDERPGLVEGLQFGIQKLKDLICAPLIPLALVLVLGFFIFLFGALGNIPYAGELLVAVFLLLAMVFGFFIALLLAGTVGGFTLMFPTIAYEGSGSFDAINHSFSHIYARPWRMGFYTLVAAVYGGACYVFVRLFIFTLLWCTHLFLWLGLRVSSSQVSSINKLEAIWPTPDYLTLFSQSPIQMNWSEQAAALIIWLVGFVVFACMAAFVISFFFSANTIIYALMRNKVDNVPIEEVYIQSETDSKDATSTADLPTDSQDNKSGD